MKHFFSLDHAVWHVDAVCCSSSAGACQYRKHFKWPVVSVPQHAQLRMHRGLLNRQANAIVAAAACQVARASQEGTCQAVFGSLEGPHSLVGEACREVEV